MGYLSCNAESAIATCDSYNWPELKRKAKINKPGHHKKPVKIRKFSYADVAAATDGFSAGSFLGKGSHGSVYKAVLDDGKLVAAVKRTKLISNAKTTTSSFHENEIEILSRVRHPRLVNLIGFCEDSGERNDNKIIVVEYMPNGSLYDILHCASRPPGWARRVRYGLQVAKAVHALHASSPPVIHRDIKSSNVLIDEDWNARLGDFGLALRGHVEDVRVKCTPPAGTLGYLDPCYLAPGDLSAKSDVFSFGILLLEIISGRNAIDVNYSPPSIVDWAGPIIRRGDYANICDSRIGPPPDPALARHLAVLAARCVRSTAEKRPPMSEVVECLKIISKRIHAPPMWNNLRRRVRCAEVSTEPLLSCHSREACDENEVEAAAAEIGRRIIRGAGQNQKVRSKSIGSFREMAEVGPVAAAATARRTAGVAVKMAPAVVRLRKSRSVGVSRSNNVVKRRGLVVSGSELTGEFDMSELVISLDEKMLEKPLVSRKPN